VIFSLTFCINLLAEPARPLTALSPVFAPDYRPAPGSDEAGFWFQVDKIEREVQRSPVRVRDEALNTYVEQIVCRLAGDYCDNVRVYIIKNPHFNASMYPNGMMHVWTGLMLRVESEAQLAAVLGHEIGHYLRAHQISQWRRMRDGAGVAAFFDMVLTGGLATLAVLGNAMSFGRDQEIEADTFGLDLMVAQGYQPQAAADLWRYVHQEAEADESKRESSLFFESHPQPVERIQKLEARTASLSEEFSDAKGFEARWVEMMTPHYQNFMADHIALQEYEQTASLLNLHTRLGYPVGLVQYFYGELYRLRKDEGDPKLAIAAYRESIASGDSPAQAHRELGYLLLRADEKPAARKHFQAYLKQHPDASDVEMIKYYIDSLEQKRL
jgi:predicted Zn-dependent protease